MSAKITGAVFDALEAAIRPLDTDELRAAYRARDPRIPRIELVKDIDRRYRFDLFWRLPSDARTAVYAAYDRLTDAHLETALKRIVPPL